MDEPLQVLCLSTEPDMSAQVNAMLGGLPGFAVTTRELDYQHGLRDLRDPDLAVVILGADPLPGLAVIEEVHRSAPSTQVLALARDQNPETIVKAMRAGADEFLPFPVDITGLLKVCIKVSAIRESAKPSSGPRGEVWVVYSPKGGVGVTTLVANLAFAVRAAQRDVALVDLDVTSGDLALFLNVNPGYTLRDIAINFKRLDSVFLQGTLIRHGSGLELLAAPPPTLDEPLLTLSSEQTLAVLELLDGAHEVTLVDTPAVPLDSTRTALTCADRILLVTELTLPALRACLRTLEWLRAEGIQPETTVELVVNKYVNRSWEIAPAEASRTLGLPIRALLPRDDAAVCTAINSGMPLERVRGGASLQRAIANLATPREARVVTRPARKGFRRFFSTAERRV